MKRAITYFLPVVMLCSLPFAGCRNNSTSSGQANYELSDTVGKAVITFSEVEHDFGKIKEGERVAYIFTFTNSGDADLVVNSVLSSCGCTVPKFERRPVRPGGKGSVEVAYDSSGRDGQQTKTITVQSNAENKIVILRITAEVMN